MMQTEEDLRTLVRRSSAAQKGTCPFCLTGRFEGNQPPTDGDLGIAEERGEGIVIAAREIRLPAR
jgi:hypothetical protein